MVQPSPFDPGGFFEFDLAAGAVRARSGQRMMMLSDAVLATLVATAVQYGDLTAVRRLGQWMGEEVAYALGGAALDASPEQVLGHARGMIALCGWGQLEMQRWGDALLATVHGLPSLDADELAAAALLGGLFSSLGRREVACVPVDGAGRFLIVAPQIAEAVWTWAQDGEDVPSLVRRLAAPEGV